MSILKYANRLLVKNRDRLALELLEDYLQQFPEDRQVAAQLGKLYLQLADSKRAIHWLKHALGRDAEPTGRIEPAGQAETDCLTADDLAFIDEEARGTRSFDYENLDWPTDTTPSQAPPAAKPAIQTLLFPLTEAIHPEEAADTGEAADTEAEAATETDADLLEEADDLFVDNADDLPDDPEPPLWELFPEDDVVEADDAEDAPTDLTSRLTPRERAGQIATELAIEAGWPKAALPVLIDVLEEHRSHGKTRQALRELLCAKLVTPRELALLHDIRHHWREGGYNRCYRRNQATDGWLNASWPLTLRLVRSLGADDVQETFLFIDDCFEDWSANQGLLDAHPVFAYYLSHVLDVMEQTGEHTTGRMPLFLDYSMFPDEDDSYAGWRPTGVSYPPSLELHELLHNEDHLP